MDPTLTLEIPFIFLCRSDLKNNQVSKWAPEERDARTFRLIHETLASLCDNVPIRKEGELDDRDPVWSLRLLPKSSSVGGHLTDDEKETLGSNVWFCDLALRRSDIPLNKTGGGWRRFEKEAKDIFEQLKTAFQDMTAKDEKTGQTAKWWRLVAGEECWLDFRLVPCPYKNGVAETLDPELVKNIVIVWTGLEREMALLATPPGLLEFWPCSRWLEYRAIQQMLREKAGLWKKLKSKEGLSEKRKGTMYQRDKEKWLSGFDDDDLKYERTQNRRREWWDVVEGIHATELIEEVRAFQETGKRLAVEVDVTVSDTEHSETDIASSVQSMSLPSYRSTLAIDALIAHTEFVCSLLHLACTSNSQDLAAWLESFRGSTLVFDNNPLCSFVHLLDTLNVSTDTTEYLTTDLQPLYSETPTDINIPTQESLRQNPFHPITTFISKSLAEQRTYIPSYISRYTAADGFYPTKGHKVYALMLVEGHRQQQLQIRDKDKDDDKAKDRKRLKKRGKEWLDALPLRDVVVAPCDANERDEDLDETGRQSPTWENVKGRDIRRWIREQRVKV